jgi:hypothetical protein
MDQTETTKPVLYATLTFDRGDRVHEAQQFAEYQRWLTKVARTTRVCLKATVGWDPVDQHLHLAVECPPSKEDYFHKRLERVDFDKAWTHKHYKLEKWDEDRAEGARDYIILKHQPSMLSACAGVRKACRRGSCVCRPKD